MSKSILENISGYYTDKVEKFGATSKGVDWNGEESQYLRFKQLSKIISIPEFSILDYGCGYGEYLNFLNKSEYIHNYLGVDISKKMIEVARNKFPKYSGQFSNDLKTITSVDYTIASGIFSVKNKINDEDWLKYFESELRKIDYVSRKGFAFNALTSYSDSEHLKDYLYYADPLYIFDFCKRNFSKNVALLHDYNLYEFTIIVRK